jgi:sigma-E factor negative regulatory protein RseA
MEKISQLMDGELEGQECGLHIRRLTQDAQLAKRWDTYHLIRDVLRAEAGTRVDLVEPLRSRLQAEPTVLAPRRRLYEVAARIAMPVAAAVAGVVVGGWLVNPTQPVRIDPIATAPAPGTTLVAHPLPPVAAQANGQVKEYLVAHQEFSPSSAMQGAWQYARTLSVKDADNAQ